MADSESRPAKGVKRAAKSAPVAKKTAPRKARGTAAGGGDLRAEMRDFASARPEGWGHADWLSFLEHLAGRGHDTADVEGIGRALEMERLAVTLEQVAGLGPRRVEALSARYGTLWSLSRADVDEIAKVPGMNRPLAEKVRQALK